MNPYFSIIIPIYNVEKYLERCIQSVLEQSYTNYEIILVDDGSTDSCPDICDQYEKQDSRISVIHKENGGLSSARNTGMRKAKGDYILFVDSDDWVENRYLSALCKGLNGTNVDLVKFNYYRYIEKDIPQYSSARGGMYRSADEIESLLDMALHHTGKYCMSAWLHGYNRKFIVDNNLYFISEREVGSEDYLFNLQVLFNAKSAVIIEDCLYHYDLREGSLTQHYRDRLAEQYTAMYTILNQYLVNIGKSEQYQKMLCDFYVWSLLHNVCLVNEYREQNGHTVKSGRKKVKRIFSMPEFQHAIRKCDKSRFNMKENIQLCAMKYKFELLFYYLFAIKAKGE